MNFIIYLLLIFCSTPEEPVLEWQTEKSFDFGILTLDHPDTTYFVFKNIGLEPLVIDNVRTACGCTATKWTDDIIQPDSVTTIAVEFNAHKLGYFRKKIKVFVSTQRKGEVLWVEGEVVEAGTN